MAEDSRKDAKMQALKIAIEQIEKQHGRGAIMKLDEGPIARMDFISTGSISLDAAIGIGGIPRGRITSYNVCYTKLLRIWGDFLFHELSSARSVPGYLPRCRQVQVQGYWNA